MKQENKCLFLDGPWDGKMVQVSSYMLEYRVAVSKPIPLDLNYKISVYDKAYTEHRYLRTTRKTFLYKGEV